MRVPGHQSDQEFVAAPRPRPSRRFATGKIADLTDLALTSQHPASRRAGSPHELEALVDRFCRIQPAILSGNRARPPHGAAEPDPA